MSKFADMFIDPEADPRPDPPPQADERATLDGFLRWQRETLELKCAGPRRRRAGPAHRRPSTMSLLGLVRHMADVERIWFRRGLAGQDAPPCSGPLPTRTATSTAPWPIPASSPRPGPSWRARSPSPSASWPTPPDLDVVGDAGHDLAAQGAVHMIEEYARHNGHADLLRERIDGRIGQ